MPCIATYLCKLTKSADARNVKSICFKNLGFIDISNVGTGTLHQNYKEIQNIVHHKPWKWLFRRIAGKE